MDAAAVGVAQKEARQGRIDQQHVFHRVVFFLPAITIGLFSSILGADAAPFDAVMGTRGDLGAEVTGESTRGTGASARGVITAAASATVTPSRCARAARERAGVSPRLRSAACRAGNRT